MQSQPNSDNPNNHTRILPSLRLRLKGCSDSPLNTNSLTKCVSLNERDLVGKLYLGPCSSALESPFDDVYSGCLACSLVHPGSRLIAILTKSQMAQSIWPIPSLYILAPGAL